MNISSSIISTRQAGRQQVLLRYMVPSLLAIAAVWLPFGFSMLGHIEEWDLLGLFNIYGLFTTALIDSPLAPHAMRPLMPLTFAIAHWLAPDSFSGFHVLLIVALAIKGGTMTFLVSRMTGASRWAVLAGPLTILFPADTMQLSFRSLHINWSLSLVLLACALIIIATEQARAWRKYALGATAGLLVLAAACMYEAALMLVPMPLLLVYASGGFRTMVQFVRDQWRVLCVGFSGALGYLVYVAWISSKITTYQGSIAGGGQSPLKILWHALPKLFTRGMLRSLAGGWYDAIAMVGTDFVSYSYLLVAALLIGIAVYFAKSAASNAKEEPHPTGPLKRMLTAGAILCMLGYAPFLLLPSHLVITQRTFLWATPGAVLVWIGVLMLLSRWRSVPAVILTFVLLTAGLGAQLVQHHHYARISETQRLLLKAIVENVEGNLGNKTLLILDDSNSLVQTWVFPGDGLTYALAYFYGRVIGPIEICRTAGMEWQRFDKAGNKGSCLHDDTGWTLRYAEPASGPDAPLQPRQPDVHLADDAAMVVKIDQNFVGSNPATPAAAKRPQLNDGGLTARRYHGVLDTPTWPQHWQLFRDQQVSNAYKSEFGDWWNLDMPVRGTGWREPGWHVGKFHHNAITWKASNTGTLQFTLTPSNGAYRLRGKFGNFASDAAKSDMRIKLNGQEIPVRWGAEGKFEGEVADHLLLAGVNRIDFTSPVALAFYGLSAELDWFEVAPK